MRKYFLCICIIFLFFTACQKVKKVEKKEAESTLEVETAQVTTRILENRVQTIGEVKAEKEVLLSSQFDGRIVLLSFLPGDKAKEGTLIAKIRRREADAISRTLKSGASQICVGAPKMLWS